MGKRKLSIEEQAQAAAKQAVLEKRSDEVNEAEKMALYETRRKAITSVLPDFNVPQDADCSEVENWAYGDLSTLPKWLGDIIEKIEGGKTGYLNSLDRVATDAAREAAEIAEHAAFIEAYSKVYRETFEKQFTLAVAERERRVVTEYDYENIVDGDAKKTVHIFATEAEADAFRETLNDREVKRREEARLLRQREEDGPLADIYELTGVKRRTKD